MKLLFEENTSSQRSFILAASFVAFFVVSLRPIEAFDTFWQLQSGKFIWQNSQFIYKDTFSLASENFRMEHCWLHDLILYLFYATGGYQLLSLLKPLIIAFCGAILVLRGLKLNCDPLLVLPIILLCLIGSEPSWLVRPQLWTFLFSLLSLQVLFAGRENGWRSWLWLAPIMVVWANLHAGCVFGLVLIGLFGVGELCRTVLKKQTWLRVGELLGMGTLAFAAAFINPYGYRIPVGQLLGHLKQHKVMTGEASVILMGNMEWLPPSFDQAPLFYGIMALWGFLVLMRLKKIDPAEAVLYVAFFYMGVSQIRHTTLVAMLAGFFLPLAMQEVLGRARFLRPQLLRTVRGFVVLTLVVAALFVTAPLVDKSWGWGIKKTEYPIAATDFIAEHKLPGNLFNSYDWGGYLMWRLYPAYLVFVDGRSTSPKFFKQSSIIDSAGPGWQGLLTQNHINTIVTRTCFYDTGEPLSLVFQLAKAQDWELVFADEVALVFTRTAEDSRAFSALDKSLAYESMYQEAKRLLAEDPQRVKAYLAMALASWKMGRHQEAAQIFDNQIQKFRLVNEFNHLLGNIR